MINYLAPMALGVVLLATSDGHGATGIAMKVGQGFQYPELVLQDRLATIFTIDRCEYISGLTCRIRYNGKAPLPSEVFFVEVDAEEKAPRSRVRLIYPRLKSGESGKATFRLRSSSAARIILTGEWKGPWKNPY
jgi:hypothetical protein